MFAAERTTSLLLALLALFVPHGMFICGQIKLHLLGPGMTVVSRSTAAEASCI